MDTALIEPLKTAEFQPETSSDSIPLPEGTLQNTMSSLNSKLVRDLSPDISLFEGSGLDRVVVDGKGSYVTKAKAKKYLKKLFSSKAFRLPYIRLS